MQFVFTSYSLAAFITMAAAASWAQEARAAGKCQDTDAMVADITIDERAASGKSRLNLLGYGFGISGDPEEALPIEEVAIESLKGTVKATTAAIHDDPQLGTGLAIELDREILEHDTSFRVRFRREGCVRWFEVAIIRLRKGDHGLEVTVGDTASR